MPPLYRSSRLNYYLGARAAALRERILKHSKSLFTLLLVLHNMKFFLATDLLVGI